MAGSSAYEWQTAIRGNYAGTLMPPSQAFLCPQSRCQIMSRMIDAGITMASFGRTSQVTPEAAQAVHRVPMDTTSIFGTVIGLTLRKRTTRQYVGQIFLIRQVPGLSAIHYEISSEIQVNLQRPTNDPRRDSLRRGFSQLPNTRSGCSTKRNLLLM